MNENQLCQNTSSNNRFSRVEVGRGGAGHLHVVTAQHEEKSVETKPNEVEDHHHLDGTFGPQAEALQQVTPEEDTNTSTRDGYATWGRNRT